MSIWESTSKAAGYIAVGTVGDQCTYRFLAYSIQRRFKCGACLSTQLEAPGPRFRDLRSLATLKRRVPEPSKLIYTDQALTHGCSKSTDILD